MVISARYISGQLVWTRHATVQAWWVVSPFSYRYASGRRKREMLDAVRAVLGQLGPTGVLMGLCARLDPGSIAERVVTGVDLDTHPELARSTLAVLDGLTDAELFERQYFLGVELPETTSRGALRSRVSAGWSTAAAQLGLTPPPVTTSERDERARQAADLGARLGRYLTVRPARRDELVWILDRAARRGLGEPTYPEPAGTPERPDRVDQTGRLHGPSLHPFGDVVLYEGGRRDDAGPRGPRSYLRVEVPDGGGGEPAGAYQCYLALGDVPERFAFPGAEWLVAADAVNMPVDWCVWVRAEPNDAAQRRATRQSRTLDGQYDEYEADPAGPPPALARAHELVADERARLAANPTEPELRATTVMCVWHENLTLALEQARMLRTGLGEFGLHAPTGEQAALFTAFLPGAAPPAVLRDYEQYHLPQDLAGAMPFAASQVGDPTGGLLGVSIDDHTARPVLLDPSLGPGHDRDGNVLVAGNMGGGKTYTLMRLAEYQLDRGNRLIGLDLTIEGEWCRFADAVTDRHALVPVTAASDALCLDPLRVFDGPVARQLAKGALGMLARVSGTDMRSVALGEAITTVADKRGRLTDVIDELLTKGRADPDARQVGRALAHQRDQETTAFLFGHGDPLDVSGARMTVFHAPSLQLPDPDTDGDRADLLDEQIASQAMLYLLGATARRVAYADKRVYCAYIGDEYGLYRHNPVAARMIAEFITGGRKNNAGVWLASQSIAHFPADLLQLMSVLGIFRMSRPAARNTLATLDIDATDTLLDRVEAFGPGDCLLRDPRRRLGMIHVATSPLPERDQAFRTTPPAAIEAAQP